jgi:hypothetical protein
MNQEPNIEQLETSIAKTFQGFLDLVPPEIQQTYNDLPQELKNAVSKDIEKILSSGAENPLSIEESEEVELTNLYSAGRALGAIRGVLDKAAPAFQGSQVLQHLLSDYLQMEKLVFQEAISLENVRWNDFIKGYGDSLSKSLKQKEGYAGEGLNFLLHMSLMLCWPQIKTFKNISMLYDFVVKEKLYFGDIDSFRRLCGRLGIRLKERGRPVKNHDLQVER